MLRKAFLSVAAGGFLSVFGITTTNGAALGQCYEIPSGTDSWDIAQGVTILQTSGMRPGSDIRDMFGGKFSLIERERAIFQDIIGNSPSGSTNSPGITN